MSALKQSEKKTSAYDTSATVRRIEDGIAWVHIPGGVDETPVKLTIAAAPGDTVQVRVSGGRAFLVGNASAPPTDDTVATGAVRQISAVRKVVEKVREVAETASRIAGNTNQYFWHTSTGTDTGAHITEIPQEDFLADPENGGGNLLARSNGIAVRDGLDELATFGAEQSTIGKTTDAHLDFDYHSMQAVDLNGYTYFHVSDLRDKSGSATLVAIEVYDGNGTITLAIPATEIVSVTIDDVETTSYTFDGDRTVTLTDAASLAGGETVAIIYTTNGNLAKAYTLGRRMDNSAIGPMSLAIGYNGNASGFASLVGGSYSSARGPYSIALGSFCEADASHSFARGIGSVARGNRSTACGYYAVANGADSHAFGQYVNAPSSRAFVVGQYNDVSKAGLFSVGNGTSESSRSTAFYVERSGRCTGQKVRSMDTVEAGAVTSYTPTWSSGQTAHQYHCVVSAGICSFFYMGASVAHTNNTQLAQLPEGARPTSQLYVPFVKMAGGVVGVVRITAAGVVEVSQITNTTNTGRIYFNCTFPVV
jgi:hypothetical protein